MRYSVIIEKQITFFVTTLNPKHIKSLKKLIEFYSDNRKGAKLGDLQLENPQYANFRILGLLDLASRTSLDSEERGEQLWYPTVLGKKFLLGEAQCYNKVGTINNVITPLDHEAWASVRDRPQLKFIHEILNDPKFQKYEDFREQRSEATRTEEY